VTVSRPWLTSLVALALAGGGARADDPPAPAGETHKTTNFVVTAPSAEVARTVAAEAEAQRVAVARRWFGDAPPAWPRPCAIRVTLAPGPSGGATTFDFGPGPGDTPVVTFAAMDLRGDLRQLLASVLPHELTHLALAHHFGKPLPRWADEGVALLSETTAEQVAQDARCRDLIGEGRGIRLRALVRMMDYPPDLMATYTQGHSLVRFLALAHAGPAGSRGGVAHGIVARVGAARFLDFLRRGTDANTADGWDRAAKDVYGYESVDALEEAWLKWLAARESVLAPGAAERSRAPWAKDVPADMIPPTELPGSGQPVAAADGAK
jgi:hypothetical protein